MAARQCRRHVAVAAELEEVAQLLGLSVLLPLLLYYANTRWMPGNGRDLGLQWGVLYFSGQLALLFLLQFGLLWFLTARIVRNRCHELLLPVPPLPRLRWGIVLWIVSGILATGTAVALYNASHFDSGEGNSFVSIAVNEALCQKKLPIAVALVFLLMIMCAVRKGRQYEAYYGSLARTLLPVFALALILLNFCARPYLRMEEQRLLQRDTLLRFDPATGCQTALEGSAMQKLKAEKAAGGGKGGEEVRVGWNGGGRLRPVARAGCDEQRRTTRPRAQRSQSADKPCATFCPRPGAGRGYWPPDPMRATTINDL
ncbi:MAG: hypothetical protein ACOYOU_07200 [Kiritimatiellia bacterium]